MSDYRDFFKDKKITLMGLGLLGRGVGDALFLSECGAHLTVTDLKTQEALQSSLAQLEGLENVTYVLGKHREEDFTSADMVFKAAGVPHHCPYIEAAQKAGVPVYMSTALFARFARERGVKIIGVTGTRGKSTVTQLIYEGLKACKQPVHLGGNVRGTSTLSLLPDVKDGDYAVLELDSWQLQGFAALKISPDIAVFTNLMRDHMNYYKDDMKAYYEDKAAIFSNQGGENILICGEEVFETIKKDVPVSKIIIEPELPSDWNLTLPGYHNRRNAAYALAALKELGFEEEDLKEPFENYQGLEGRLFKIGERDGIVFYNDSNATTPAATMAALNSFEGEDIHLIVGGSDKGLELEELAQAIKNKAASAVFLAGSGTEKLMPFFPEARVEQSMDGAFQYALQQAGKGGIVLLSPGFASFGLFRNEYDRSDQFKALANSFLKHGAAA